MTLTHVRNFVQAFLCGLFTIFGMVVVALLALLLYTRLTAPSGQQVGVDVVSFFAFYGQ